MFILPNKGRVTIVNFGAWSGRGPGVERPNIAVESANIAVESSNIAVVTKTQVLGMG